MVGLIIQPRLLLKYLIVNPLRQSQQRTLRACLFSTNRTMSTGVQAGAIKKVYNDIIKSAQDKRVYRGLVLENDMKVLLISDPTTDTSSAAMDVHIGGTSDPLDLPGLAHFCEHMLFLGTEKYPEENSYSKFLSEHGGSSNAATCSEHTNYYFDCGADYLQGALDRFAQFFLCPLFTPSATEREVNAVNSENDKNLLADSWRINQIEKCTGDPNHAYSRFFVGNKDTLLIRPREKGIDVREELLKFHQKFYSSNIMSLAVLGRESVDDLQAMVVPLFHDVQNKNVTVPSWSEGPYTEDYVKLLCHVVPVKDIRMLSILWPMPDLHPYYKTSPGHYLGHLIGHEGKGSLLSELKNNCWVNNLVGGENGGANGFTSFAVNVDLTEQGIDHVDDIVTLTFQYLSMLRQEGTQKWVFEECRDLSAMNFRFKDKEAPRFYTRALAGTLHDYPMNEVLSAPYLANEYKPDLIEMVLSHLTPDKVRIGVVGKKFEGQTDRVEEWYGTHFKVTPIPQQTLDSWRNVAPNPNLSLPRKNEFIPTNFDLAPREEDGAELSHVIYTSPMTRLWFKQDDAFYMPKAFISLNILSPYAYMDPLSSNMSSMFVTLFHDALTEYTYDAELAGLAYSLNSTIYGLVLTFKGYNEKQHVLLERVLERMGNLKIDPQRFAIWKEAHLRSLKNFTSEEPHQHALYFTSVLLSEQLWTKDELIDAMDEMTLERLEAFVPQMLSKLFIEMLVYGNVTKTHARSIAETVENKLKKLTNTKPLPASQQRRCRTVQLEDGSSYVYHRTSEVHKGSGIEVYYQCGLQETASNMVLELFSQIIKEHCFDILRTKEQLGYIVMSGLRRANGVQGLRFLVQSDRTPNYVDARIEAFVHRIQSFIAEMDEVTFRKHLEALATKRLDKPKKMWAQNSAYWGEIVSQQYNFDRDNIEVAYLRKLTKEDVLNFYQDLIAHDAPHRHKLAVHVTSLLNGNATAQQTTAVDASDELHIEPTLKEAEEITEISSFKQRLCLFSVAPPYIPLSLEKAKL